MIRGQAVTKLRNSLSTEKIASGVVTTAIQPTPYLGSLVFPFAFVPGAPPSWQKVRQLDPYVCCATDVCSQGGDDVQLKIVYAKATHALAKPPTTTIKDLKAEIETLTGCPASTMKLMYKGSQVVLLQLSIGYLSGIVGLLSAPNKPELDERTLAEATITKKAKILVVGASADDLQSVAAVRMRSTRLCCRICLNNDGSRSMG
jgi:hypothetical protein